MLKNQVLQLLTVLTVEPELLSSETPSACMAVSDIGFSTLSPPAAKTEDQSTE